MSATTEPIETASIGDIDDVADHELILVADSAAVRRIGESVGVDPEAEGYGGAFVATSDGDYTEVWFFPGSVAFNHKTAYRYI